MTLHGWLDRQTIYEIFCDIMASWRLDMPTLINIVQNRFLSIYHDNRQTSFALMATPKLTLTILRSINLLSRFITDFRLCCLAHCFDTSKGE